MAILIPKINNAFLTHDFLYFSLEFRTTRAYVKKRFQVATTFYSLPRLNFSTVERNLDILPKDITDCNACLRFSVQYHPTWLILWTRQAPPVSQILRNTKFPPKCSRSVFSNQVQTIYSHIYFKVKVYYEQFQQKLICGLICRII